MNDRERLLTLVDHLVYAAPDLDDAVDGLAARLGVRAAPGGSHAGRGTRNALLALGPARYLEIIAPDPDQPAPAAPRWFGIDSLRAPCLAGWAAKGGDLDRLVREASSRGVPLGPVAAGSRRRPDGEVLAWRLTDPALAPAGGVAPFFIDWGSGPHPGDGAPQGVALLSLRAEHPEPRAAAGALAILGVPLAVAYGPRPALVAALRTARGEILLS